MDFIKKLEGLSESSDTSVMWKGTFREFLAKFEEDRKNNANIGVLAHQRVYNMIMSEGTNHKEHFGKDRISYGFFEDTLFGIEDSIDDVMSYLHSAAQKTETSRRMLLLYGPPSSGKSQLVSCIKRGLESYTRTPEGAIYALAGSQMHENPFLLVPESIRPDFEKKYGLRIEGQLSPSSAFRLKEEFCGKFMDFPVEQIFIDEASRVGIGTWLPQDPKTVSTDTTRVFIEGRGIVRLSSIFALEKQELDKDGFAKWTGTAAALDQDEKIIGIYDHGVLPMFRVNAGGIWIDCTLKHRLMTLSSSGELEWNPLEYIKDDMPLLIKAGMRKFASRAPLLKSEWAAEGNESCLTCLTPDMSEIVGGLVAEGFCTTDSFFYCNTDKELVNRFMDKVEKTFGVIPVFSEARDKQSARGVSLSTRLSRWLETNFAITRANMNSVPDFILAGTEEDHIAFLEGMFLCGGVLASKVNDRYDRHDISSSDFITASIRFGEDECARFCFSACSENLAMDIQSMLLNLGVFTRMHLYVDKHYDKYQVVCEGSEVYILAKMLPVFAEHCKFGAVKKAEHTECCSNEFFGSLSGLIAEIRENTKGTCELIDRRYEDKAKNKRILTRATLEKWYDELNNNIEWTCSDRQKRAILDKLDVLLSYRCVKLINTEYIGVKHGVDLSCKSEPFSYIANGFVSHNSQDQSELVGGIDFSKIQEYGDEADPRTYNFNGELNVANRGVMEFIEGIKGEEKFLRVLLTATQEKVIKAPRFGLIYCDTFIILHTNESEFREFMQERKYEAYHDRMVIISVPYNMSVSNEVKIYEKLLSNSDAIKNMHIAPKSLEAAAMFAIMSRLSVPENSELTLVKKMKLYDKQDVKGYKTEQVPNMKKKNSSEGMSGVSPRFVIDQISAAIASAKSEERNYITALDILRQLNKGVSKRDSFTKEQKNHYEALIDQSRGEWDDILRNDIQKAFFVSYDREARNLCENYLDQIQAACAGQKPTDPVTGQEIELDEKLMDAIEEQIDISQSGKEDFRNEIIRAVAGAVRKGKKFDYTEHADLRIAIQKKLFEERKNVIRMTVSTRNPDPEELKRINDVVARMEEQQGYSPAAANALLKYATSHLFDK